MKSCTPDHASLTMDDVCVEAAALLRKADQLGLQNSLIGTQQFSSRASQADVEANRDQFFVELDELCQEAVNAPASTLGQLACKAHLLTAFLSPEDGDLAHRLGYSIANDFLGIIATLLGDIHSRSPCP